MGITGTSGVKFKEQRKVSLEILRHLGMGKNVLAERIQEEVAQYIKALHSHQGQPVDLREMTKASISNNICSILFGRRFEYDDPEFTRYLAMVADTLKSASGTALLNFFPWLKHLPGDLFNFKKVLSMTHLIETTFLRPQLDNHILNHTNGNTSDFIHAYIVEIQKRRDSGQATSVDEDNLQQLIRDFFFAGTETTATAICWALVYILHRPEVQDKCYKEIQRVVGTENAPSMLHKQKLAYVEATVMEHGLACDVNFQGHVLPKDTMVLPFLESVLHDSELWENPLSFRPERFIGPDGKLTKPDEFIPFSTGRRLCVGESLARMELFLYLATMIQHFRFLPPEDGQLPSLEGLSK
nr:hypothetical protein BaRGS_009260 [Batillaria attramentaria]